MCNDYYLIQIAKVLLGFVDWLIEMNSWDEFVILIFVSCDSIDWIIPNIDGMVYGRTNNE